MPLTLILFCRFVFNNSVLTILINFNLSNISFLLGVLGARALEDLNLLSSNYYVTINT